MAARPRNRKVIMNNTDNFPPPDEELAPGATTDELANLIDEKEKSLRAGHESLSIVEAEDIRLSKEVLKLQIMRKDNQAILSKARHNVQRISSELRELRNRFWRSRDGG